MPCKHEYFKESEVKDLFKGKNNQILIANHHKTSHLARVLVKNASRESSELTKLQLEARSMRFDDNRGLYSIKVFAEKLERQKSKKSEFYLDLVRKFTTHYIDIYDKLFFFGSLFATGRVTYRVAWMEENEVENSLATTTPHFDQDASDRKVTDSVIDLFVEADPKYTTQEQVREWLGTLAHEMLHAFMFTFGCLNCHMPPEQLTVAGHGHAWQDAAYEIEVACERLLTNNVDVGRWVSLYCDVLNGKMPMPKESLLRKWDMIGPIPDMQTPVVPKIAGKTNDVERKSSKPSSAEKQLPHRPTEKTGGGNDKREGAGKSGERAPPPRKEEKRDPLRKDGREEKRVPPKSSEHGREREKPEPSKSGERAPPRKEEKRDPRKDGREDPRKDGREEKRVPPKSGEYGKEREKPEPSKSGERAPPRKEEKRDPRKDGREEKRAPPKSGEHAPRREEKRDPPRKDGREEKRAPSKSGERAAPQKDDKGERRDHTRSRPNEEKGSSRNTSKQDLTPGAEKKSSRKPDTPKRRTPLE
ncbi:hypothetical protein BELL_0225g00060 [Botrytis elliptica]|uniref:SprT-like domain-containing protein n=1 Tax=Botrytis elliptica TaxID=278938 RepID=A0A4Z1JNA5_9HELO|nr:hypothetical protein BELL_0225g00060 [Botrytis elliptica]